MVTGESGLIACGRRTILFLCQVGQNINKTTVKSPITFHFKVPFSLLGQGTA